MQFKFLIKCFMGWIRCKKYNIEYKKGVYIGNNTNVIGGKNIKFGEYVCIRPEVDLWSCGGKIDIGLGTEIGQRDRISIAHTCKVGERVLISPNVYITDCDHEWRDISIPVMNQGIVDENYNISIGDHSFIGINSVIIGNIKIGKHCIIGANSVVTKDVPNYCVAVGAPARIVKRYSFESGVWEKV